MIKKSQIKRSADLKIYLNNNEGYNKPKEIFKFIESLAFKKKRKNLKILDVGCAAGHFLYYLKKKNPDNNFTGIDTIKPLLIKAKKKLPSCIFKKKTVLNSGSFKPKIFDIIFMLGVHSIFSDFKKPLKNIFKWSSKNAEIFIFGRFNPFPADVFTYFKYSNDFRKKNFEAGSNNFSIKSVSNFLIKQKRIKSFSFIKFEMPYDLNIKKDPIRSWTVKDSNGKRLMINGLGLIQNQYVIKIKLM